MQLYPLKKNAYYSGCDKGLKLLIGLTFFTLKNVTYITITSKNITQRPKVSKTLLVESLLVLLNKKTHLI